MSGRKVFVSREVLASTDVQAYLMDQVVMRFASANARSVQYPEPDDGAVSYLEDVRRFERFHSGADAWLRFGSTPWSEVATATNLAFTPVVGGGWTTIPGLSVAGLTIPARCTLEAIVTVPQVSVVATSTVGLRIMADATQLDAVQWSSGSAPLFNPGRADGALTAGAAAIAITALTAQAQNLGGGSASTFNGALGQGARLRYRIIA